MTHSVIRRGTKPPLAAFHFCDITEDSACGRHRLRCSPSMHRYTPRAAFFMALCLLFAVPCDLEPAHSQESGVDKARYALAVAYCRGDVERPISLSADRQTLCFDGVIPDDLDFSQVNDLKNSGLFVVRSNGGFAGPAINISNLLDAKRATVVVYDYCLSACANYFFFASARTYVFEKTIV